MAELKYEIIDNIFSIEKGNQTIQLNKMKWGNNAEKYDLRVWKEDKPLKGITLTDEELMELCQAMSEFAGLTE